MLGCPMNDVKFTCQTTRLPTDAILHFSQWVIRSLGNLTTTFDMVHWTSQHLTFSEPVHPRAATSSNVRRTTPFVSGTLYAFFASGFAPSRAVSAALAASASVMRC